jgi:spermidine synthase
VLDARGLTLLAALFASGVAGVLNQVVWQRALKIFLGGSETLSSMLVVLVFMLGLGLGAALTAPRIHRVRHPLRALALVEIALCAINVAIAFVLGMDIHESVYAVQRVAVAAGLPLRLVYALGALCVLLPPTLLMGVTLPFASEAFQRQLGARESNLLPVLFFLNTAGAALGAFGGSYYLLPYHGQWNALLAAAACNLLAASALLPLSYRVPPAAVPEEAGTGPVRQRRALQREEVLGGVLGFLSLGYEMYLLRVMALAHMPLPYTFAVTLCFFLLFWSIMPLLYALDRWELQFGLFDGCLLYFTPCFVFGLLYGQLVSRSAESWGRDVGRFYALNTAGSCLGILFFTLVGYEMPQPYTPALIAVGLLLVGGQLWRRDAAALRAGRPQASLVRIAWAPLAIGAIALTLHGLSHSSTRGRGMVTFWGRDGVVEIAGNGVVYLDGLWHAKLSDGRDHVGGPYSWYMAIAALLAHPDADVEDALVVGLGTGVTAVTLSKLHGIEVDAYEINQTLKRVLQGFPSKTLQVASRPNIQIFWQDARSGMALNPKKYDVILSAPLHLKQAGSSLLLSREYLKLVQSRLAERGVAAFYSYERDPAQALLVRNTVRSVFDYAETFRDGVVTVASNRPIRIDRERTLAQLRDSPALLDEIADYEAMAGAAIDAELDRPRLPWRGTDYVVTDDHPLVEYPSAVKKLIPLDPTPGAP